MSIENIVQREQHKLNKTNIDNTSIIAFRILDGIKDILDEDRKQSQPLFLSINEKMLMMIVKNIIDNPQKHYMVGITGESASGKTTLVNNISEAMRKKLFDDAYTCIYCDDYYIDTSKELKDAGSYENLYKTGFSFDTPKAINLDLMRAHLISLKNGCGIYGPEYDFVSCESTPNRIYKKPTRAILSEGLYVLGEELADLFDIKVYVYTPFDKIKERWFSRAISRGKTGAAAEHQFKDVTQTAQIHIRPTMQKADIVINGLTSAEYIEQISTRMINLIRDIINFYK